MVRTYRRRYIAFRLIPAPSVSKREIFSILAESISKSHSIDDAEIHHVKVIFYNPDSGLCVARWDHQNIGLLRSVLGESAEAFEVSRVETLRTSGTLKALEMSLSAKIRGSA